MDELVRMGFSVELAAKALSATGGHSPSKAVDWIFTHSHSNDTETQKTTSKPLFSPFQPKLDRFFKSTDAVSPPENDIETTGKRFKASPLSERMRPRNLDEVIGQDHILSLLRTNNLPSLILWGPPGTGKTSLARALSLSSSSSFHFISLSAVSSGVKDIRTAITKTNKIKTLLFIDEVHRFNKAQQDSLLPIIEDGTITFLGATTENPSFHLTTPLLSRCRVLTLNSLNPNQITSLLLNAASDPLRGLALSLQPQTPQTQVTTEAVDFISGNCDGDARIALNALEIAAVMAAGRAPVDEVVLIGLEDVKEAMQCKNVAYDKDGEEHFNMISALHKSMRGSDGNAGIYWLARMLEGGEQPLYIARRLIRFASEDVGLADPSALNQAVACYQACHFLGMPECNVILAQCVAYLALAPKSIAVYRAIGAAQKAVRDSIGQNEGVPLHLRNAPTKLMKDIGYGKGYIYTPDDPSSFQTFLPPSLQGCKFLDWPESG